MRHERKIRARELQSLNQSVCKGERLFNSLAPLEGVAQSTEEPAVSRSVAIARGGRVFAVRAGAGGSPVSSSSSTDMPDCSLLLHHLLSGGLALEFLIEREDSLLAGVVNVTSSSTTAGELAVWLRDGGDEGGRTASRAALAGLWGLESVACTSASRVDVLGGGWVRLGD